ncbi:hypothetical protein [Hymenobacter crusticola]|uniref:Uncharacterized protein n=1 Tax=Hymenobacter crusticola TaxID=1770526 RepID=A0A243W792_9BACT|nr:hypothetical protein [Hymenobacter crusticola]OUJ67391.1 hypothetical protein BXP70_28865 [Hymenobacter crusticola]
MLPVQHNYRLVHKGCAIYLLFRLNEQQQPKTTFYIFNGHARVLVHGFYYDLGYQQQAEAILRSWVEAYCRANGQNT